MLVDTHCHVNIMVKEKFDIPLKDENFVLAEKIADEAYKDGVGHILNAGTSITECINCIQLAQKNKNMYAAVGIHPCDITPSWNKDLKKVQEFIRSKKANKIVAIGECGLDLYHQKHNITQQKNLLKAQIELSLEHNMPLTIHMRQATDEMVSVLEQFKHEPLRGVMHCFSESKDFANYAIGLGFVLGIGGPITYPKNEQLRDVVLHIPLEKIVLETDSPFLPPQIIRGKRNHPKYIAHIAQYLAELKNISLEFVAEQTTKTTFDLFGFDQFI